jgi:hypothetical protein
VAALTWGVMLPMLICVSIPTNTFFDLKKIFPIMVELDENCFRVILFEDCTWLAL